MLTVPAEISHSDAVILQAAIPSNARNSDQDDLLMIHLLLDKYGNKYQQLQNCWPLALIMMFKTKEQMLNKCVYKSIK